MSWLPTFVNPWAAAIAAGIAVPLLLLLYFLKLRRREMAISSTLLWKKTILDLQVNAPFQKLRRNLLLLLQMLLLLLIVLALARPVLNYARGAGKVTVILIDRSASMAANDCEGHTRLEEARKRALELVDTMPKDGSAMVIAFDEAAETVQAFTSDKGRLKNAINSIKQTDRRTKLKDAYYLAEAQATVYIPENNRPTGEKPDVWLFSDGRAMDKGELALKRADLKYQKIGSDQTANVGIVSLSAKRNYERPTEVQIFSRLVNDGPAPVENVDVLLSIDGQVQRVDQKLVLLPERWSQQQRDEWANQTGKLARDSVEFNLELYNSAVIKLERARGDNDPDALAADDVAQIVVPPPRAMSVLLVTDDNYFLDRLIMKSMRLKEPASIKRSKYADYLADPALIGKYDVIIFDRFNPPKLPPAGNFIYFGCLPPKTAVKPVLDGLKSVVSKDVGVLDWKRDHPIVRNLNMTRLYVSETLKLQLPHDAEEIVKGTHDAPLLLVHREGRSAHVIVPFSLMDSNWPLKPTFPVFMNNTLQYLALGADMDMKQSLQPGAVLTLPRLNLQQAGLTKPTLRINGPEPQEVTIPETGDVVLPAFNRVGLYTTEPPIPGFEKIAVSLLDGNESNVQPDDQPPGGSGTTIDAAKTRSRSELWWWILAAAAVPLCLLEWWIYTQRMHL